MKKIIFIAFLVTMLGACQTGQVKQAQPVIETVKYIVAVPPKEMLAVPEKPKAPDPATSTQRDVSDYIIDLNGDDDQLRIIISNIADWLLKEQERQNSNAKK